MKCRQEFGGRLNTHAEPVTADKVTPIERHDRIAPSGHRDLKHRRRNGVTTDDDSSQEASSAERRRTGNQPIPNLLPGFTSIGILQVRRVPMRNLSPVGRRHREVVLVCESDAIPEVNGQLSALSRGEMTEIEEWVDHSFKMSRRTRGSKRAVGCRIGRPAGRRSASVGEDTIRAAGGTAAAAWRLARGRLRLLFCCSAVLLFRRPMHILRTTPRIN